MVARLGNPAQKTGRSPQWPCVTVDTAPVTAKGEAGWGLSPLLSPGRTVHLFPHRCIRIQRAGVPLAEAQSRAWASMAKGFCGRKGPPGPPTPRDGEFLPVEDGSWMPHSMLPQKSQKKKKKVHHTCKANSSFLEPPFEMSTVTTPVFRYQG